VAVTARSAARGDAHVRPALIVDTQNVEAEAWHAATPQMAGGRLLLLLDRRSMGRFERRTLARADGVAFCSERDRDCLDGALRDGASVAVVPNSVDTDSLRPLRPPADDNEVLFLGGLGYGPNREAVRFIVAELAPLLAREGITPLIVGGDASDLGDAAAAPGSDRGGTRFLGKPADVLPAYERSFATIVPLFSGSGTRLKVLESFAYGRPVVSTAKGIEGLAAEPGVHYLPAETPQQFAAQVVTLRDPATRGRLVAAGRLLVEERYSWRVAGSAFLALLEACLAQG